MSIGRTNSYYNTYSIRLPFSFIDGRIGRVLDDSAEAYRNKVLSILNTNQYERVWHKYFGASLREFAFMNEEEVISALPQAISEAFVRWLPELSFEEVTVDTDAVDGGVVFDIYYKLPSGDSNSVKITYADLTRAGEIVKVNNNV
jgi:phage baseplate assembly protein W